MDSSSDKLDFWMHGNYQTFLHVSNTIPLEKLRLMTSIINPRIMNNILVFHSSLWLLLTLSVLLQTVIRETPSVTSEISSFCSWHFDSFITAAGQKRMWEMFVQEVVAGGQDDNSTSTTRQPSRVIYMVQDGNTGQVQLPSLDASEQPAKYNQTFIPQLLLACFVFWLFGFLFGLIAFILARTHMASLSYFIASLKFDTVSMTLSVCIIILHFAGDWDHPIFEKSFPGNFPDIILTFLDANFMWNSV